MTEQSAQHGPRLDDELSSEVGGIVRGAPIGTRAREDLDPEAATTRVPEPVDEAGHEAVLARSELARFLRPSALPADATQLLAIARDEYATEAILDELRRLPHGVAFPTIAAIWEALGHATEHRDDPQPEPDPPRTPPPAADRDEPARAAVEVIPVIRERREAEQAVDPEVSDESDSGFSLPAIAIGLLRGALAIVDRTLATVQDRLSH